MTAAVEIDGVSKRYTLQAARPRGLKGWLVERARGEVEEEARTLWALRDVSFAIGRGETVGIIGSNGSGKSTLLKLITGIVKPTGGRVTVAGRISPLIELGAGFHPDFSGRENVFLNGAILGLKRAELARRFDAIVAFAELEAFIDQPVKTYSSGMYMRLAFAIAAHVDPDVLVVDEVLAVGDAAFQAKCLERMRAFQRAGTTIVLVSHALDTVAEVCGRVAWLERGELRALGSTGEVLAAYHAHVTRTVEQQQQQEPVVLAPPPPPPAPVVTAAPAGTSMLVVTMDGRAHLETLFASLATQDGAPDEVVVVDNGSRDGTVDWLTAQHPEVRVIASATNQGFAAANNVAAEAARHGQLLLLNNDMHLAPGFMRELHAARARAPADVACIGARVLDWEGRRVDFAAAGMTFDGRGLQLGHGELAGPAGPPEEALFACGGAMLVDRQAFLDAGGFDPAFFAYYEDVDLGWRLWVMGHRVLVASAAVAHHRHGATGGRFEAHRKEVLIERNALYSMVKNYDDASLAAFLPAALLLANKRLAVRAGLDRMAWSFQASPPPGPAGVRPPVVGRAAGALLRLGPSTFARKALLKVGHKLVRRFGPPPGPEVAMSARAYATAVALEDLLDHMPVLMAERRRIQGARRRPDGAIFPLFNLPFFAVEGLGGYGEAQAALCEALGLEAYMRRRGERP